MASVGSIADRILVVFGSSFIIINVALQLVDWITSFVGYSRGGHENNWATNLLISVFGNEYLAISIEKIGFLAFFVGVFYLMRIWSEENHPALRYLGLVALDGFMLYFIINYSLSLWNNFVQLGF